MRILLALTAALILTACGSRTGSNNDEGQGPADPPDASNLVEVVLDVEGMTCEGCENAINAGLESMEGVAGSESSHQEKYTRVTYDPDAVSLDEIKTQIAETGYEVKGVMENASP